MRVLNYTDYNFYKGNYRGKLIPSSEFDFWARKSTQIIKQHTFGNIDETKVVIDEVQMCCCDISEELYKQEKRQSRVGVTSEKVGEYSKSYESSEEINKFGKKRVQQIINLWLGNTGLLYRGLC